MPSDLGVGKMGGRQMCAEGRGNGRGAEEAAARVVRERTPRGLQARAVPEEQLVLRCVSRDCVHGSWRRVPSSDCCCCCARPNSFERRLIARLGTGAASRGLGVGGVRCGSAIIIAGVAWPWRSLADCAELFFDVRGLCRRVNCFVVL